MLINKIKNYLSNLGIYYTIKLFLFIKISRLLKIKASFKIKIKTKKTGKRIIYVRPSTTDICLVNNLLLKNGEYDFIYNDEYSWIKEAKVIIDAGAYTGMFSRLIREINKDSLIIAIEPEISNYNVLKENTCYMDNIVCLKRGLWNKKCNLTILLSLKGLWGCTVKEVESYEKDSIMSIRIEDIINEYKIKTIDVLKVDIEGSEVEVFDETAKKWLDKVKMCIIEFHDRKKPNCSKKIINLLKDNNFDYIVYTENYVFINKNYI